jgi:hypothetical protein
MSLDIQGSIPAPIQKQLKKEAVFGCAICGCPLLNYIHIIPPLDKNAFLPENMAAICPNCKSRFDRHEFSESYLRDVKKNPHNRMREKDAFSLESGEMVINLGKMKYINTPRVLAVNDFDIITLKQENERKLILLDINFFDKLNNLVAIVSENSWVAEKQASTSVWEINYKPKHLVIRNNQNGLLFEARIEYQEVFIRGVMYYSGSTVKVTDNGIWVDEREIASDLDGCVLKNYDIAINAQTF